MTSPYHVLLVCTGNTCRSPLAAALLEQLLVQEGPGGITVSSAGARAVDGDPASEGAYLVALEEGLDLSAHRAALLRPEMVRSANLILAMSRSHVRRIEELGGSGKVMLLGEYAAGEAGSEEIPDPFGSDVHAYRETLHHLAHLMAGVRDRLSREVVRDQR
ncbi:MAG: low molecular weight protein arginine phosphatase [Gemmatimonadales bacterium]